VTPASSELLIDNRNDNSLNSLRFRFGTGALVGGMFDVDRATSVDSALSLLSAQIPPGSTALIVDAVETTPEPLDQLAARFDASDTVQRGSTPLSDNLRLINTVQAGPVTCETRKPQVTAAPLGAVGSRSMAVEHHWLLPTCSSMRPAVWGDQLRAITTPMAPKCIRIAPDRARAGVGRARGHRLGV
jgi:hypothetical protein